jgi:L-2-hydroxyglutarate oxidase LhgO
MALLGTIALFGMIMRNAVILVDQIEQDLAAGKARVEAIVESTVRRLRPIVLTAARLVTAPGLDAQAVAARISGFTATSIPEAHYGKGVYFRLSGRAPFARLVYPPPIHGALGTHYRRDLGGQAVFGPDLEFVKTLDYSVDPDRAVVFADYIRRFWPGLPEGALQPDYAGIRPKLHGPDQPQPDFRIDGPQAHGLDGLVVLFGIESPGLTSSLAIGEEVAGRLGL